MGLTVHFEVLNQLGTPMMYSSSLATRPSAGIAGRIFFRTDSPYGVYRDNGLSWDQIAGSGGGGLTGSGTATQVAYFDAATNLTSSANLYWDATNSRLGINTATPGVALDIHSATATVLSANNTTLGNALMNFQLQGTGKWQIGNVYSAGTNYFRIYDQLNSTERLKIQNTGQIDLTGWFIDTNTITGITGTTPSALPSSTVSNNFTYNSGITTSASVNTIGLLTDNTLNYSGANTINVTSYNTSVLQRNNLTFGTAAASITYTQAAAGIRTLTNTQNQYIQNGANSGTISHYANFQILGDQKTGAGLTTFTNRYGILINDYNEFTAGNTYTNRWGIYQAGLNESNFFAGKVGIGSGYTPGTYQLDVNGTVRIVNAVIKSDSLNNFSIGTGNAATPSSGNSNFIGKDAGLLATNASSSNFIGKGAGYNATNANYSNFFGQDSGSNVTNANFSNFFGLNAGYNAASATHSNFLGRDCGLNATGASYSTFLGYNIGNATTHTITGSNNVLIGLNITTPVAASANMFSIGNVLYGFNTNATLGNPQTAAQTNGQVSIGTNSPSASAIFQTDSTTRGILLPRMTTTQKNAISSPAQGLMIFDTTLVKLCVYSGTAWETITSV